MVPSVSNLEANFPIKRPGQLLGRFDSDEGKGWRLCNALNSSTQLDDEPSSWGEGGQYAQGQDLNSQDEHSRVRFKTGHERIQIWPFLILPSTPFEVTWDKGHLRCLGNPPHVSIIHSTIVCCASSARGAKKWGERMKGGKGAR